MGNNLKKCPKCGSEIANVATECPICNYNFLKPQVTPKAFIKGKSKIGTYSLIAGIIGILLSFNELGFIISLVGIGLGIYVLFSKKELYYGTAIAGVVVSVFALMISISALSWRRQSKQR